MNLSLPPRAARVLAFLSLAASSVYAEQPPAPAQAPAAPAAPAIDSIRYIERPDGRAEFQTAVISLKNPAGAHVDLVSAVHIADETYFEAMNQLLATYDVVLYELVGGPMEERDENKLNAELSSNRLSFSGWFESMLGLRYQLDGIDYKRPNFVHADATWEEWEKLSQRA